MGRLKNSAAALCTSHSGKTHTHTHTPIVGKNQLQCPAELIVPRQSIIISVASCFPSISSLSSLQHSSLCFSSVLFPHSLLLHHLGYCVSFHDYPLEQKKKQLWKKENSLRSHFLKRNSNLFFPGELTTKKEAWVHLFAKLQVSVVLLLTDYVEATCKLEKWTFPCWVKLCLSPSIIIIDRFRLKWLWNALSF